MMSSGAKVPGLEKLHEVKVLLSKPAVNNHGWAIKVLFTAMFAILDYLIEEKISQSLDQVEEVQK